MSGSHIQVRLSRDSFDTQWGFRLQGGKDLNQPLTVQRVFSNSPAEGELQRGDNILQIGDKKSSDLTHKQAQDLIRFGGGQIKLVIQRPPPGYIPAPTTPRSNPVQAPTFRHSQPAMPPPRPQSSGFQPKKVTLSQLGGGGPDFGSDYSGVPIQRGFTPASAVQSQQQNQMLSRVHESLDHLILSPRTPEPAYFSPVYTSQTSFQPFQSYVPTSVAIEHGHGRQGEEDDYPIEPVWERRKLFQEPKRAAPPPPKAPKPKRVSGPSYPLTKPPAFGVDYSAKIKSQHTWQPSAPQQQPVQQQYHPSVQQQFQPSVQQPVAHAPPHIHPQGPPDDAPNAPWRETLRTTGVKPWDKELQYTVEQGPPPARTQPKYTPPAPTSVFKPPSKEDQSDGPKVVHLQYNSPMGLYSSQNIKETYEGQAKAITSQGSPQGKPQTPGKPGDRDWNQSSVYRMIQEEQTRRTTTTTSSFAPSPASQQQQSYRQIRVNDDDVGVSDF